MPRLRAISATVPLLDNFASDGHGTTLAAIALPFWWKIKIRGGWRGAVPGRAGGVGRRRRKEQCRSRVCNPADPGSGGRLNDHLTEAIVEVAAALGLFVAFDNRE